MKASWMPFETAPPGGSFAVCLQALNKVVQASLEARNPEFRITANRGIGFPGLAGVWA
jgi:hypothetical protein